MAELVDNCTNYNCEPLPERDNTIEACGAQVVNSGVSDLWLFECGFLPEDPGNEAELDQMVADGQATKISNIFMGLGDPSKVEAEPGTSCGNKVTVSYDRTAQITDRVVTSANNDFWNVAKKRVYNGFVFKECPTAGLAARVSFVSAETSMEAFRKFGNHKTIPQEFSAGLSWSDIDDPTIHAWTEAP